MKTVLKILIILFLIHNLLYSNNLQIKNVLLGYENSTFHYRMIQFDISWENSWRVSSEPNNWDAAWVFIKYQISGGEWQHAMLSINDNEHIAPSGSTITPASDGKGIFIYRNSDGTGSFSLTGVQLRWNYGIDGLSDGSSITGLIVLGIEMVYIPQGSFYAGDNGTSTQSFKAGSSDNNPWHIANENEINVTDSSSGGSYYVSHGSSGEDATGSTFTIPSSFPKGYGAIYCMKYEITQGQYIDFLNLLTTPQASNRSYVASANRYTATKTGSTYSTARPDRACNYLNWADGAAYADWSGLRPMTELEYEKICRGTKTPVSNEYAWGTTNITAATTISGTEDGTEKITNSNANCSYNNKTFSGGDGGTGPLSVGIFSRSGNTREKSGATYYGVMDMSGNVWERCVTVGNSNGRSFTGKNGNGKINSTGDSDVQDWPESNGLGSGFRGGTWYLTWDRIRISDRYFAAYWDNTRYWDGGFRCVRSSP